MDHSKFKIFSLITLTLLMGSITASSSCITPTCITPDTRAEYSSKFFDLPLRLKNKSPINVYAATYLKRTIPSFDCKMVGDIQKIAPGKTAELKRPKGECLYGRKLIVAEDPNELKENFSKTEYALTVKTGIADIYGELFHVAQKDNTLRLYNFFQWNIIKPIMGFIDEVENDILEGIIATLPQYPYSSTKAYVRIEKDLAKEEIAFLKDRKTIVKKALEKLLDTTLTKDQVPNIAFCLSGGSYRAMIGSAGATLGAQEIGLLDCITHICSLSGSTWFPSFWTAHNQPLDKCIENLKDKAQTSIVFKPLDLDEVAKMFIKKTLFKEKISFIDIYGAALANCLFSDLGKEKHKITLSQTTKFLKNSKMPLPIYTSIETTTDYHWFEFTPFEIGNLYLNYYIPTWAFGRKFVNGVSQNFAPEQSFGFLMGVFGAAFSADFDEIVDALSKPKRDIYDLLYLITNRPEWEKVRISPATAYNPVYGIEENPMQNIKRLTFMDAGADGNLPFPPLLRKERNIDIIIAFDFSDGVKYSGTLKKAEAYAKKYDLKFPKIDYESAPKNFVSVFRDENDPSVPTIIYIPLIKNEKYSKTFDPEKETAIGGYCNSINFAFTKEHFDELSGLPEFIVTNYKDTIINTIKEVIESKSEKKLSHNK